MQQDIRRTVPVSMRLREDDLAIIDRAAEASGLSRTEFLCRAGLNEAKLAILNETVVRLSPQGFDAFVAAIETPAAQPTPKLRERLARPAPWTAPADDPAA